MTDQDLEKRMHALESELADLRRELAESQLDDWKARIDQLEVQAHLAQMEADDQLQPLLDKMRNRYLDARSQFDKASSAAGDALNTVTDGVRSAAKDLGDALSDAVRKVTPNR
jgi:chromosome segregation ATPase